MLTITERAAGEMRRLLNAQERPDWGVRVGVKSGVGAERAYTLSIDREPAPHDRIFEQDGVHVFCDPHSSLYLEDISIDFSADLMDGGFRFVQARLDAAVHTAAHAVGG